MISEDRVVAFGGIGTKAIRDAFEAVEIEPLQHEKV
jgi:hypothetical protein